MTSNSSASIGPEAFDAGDVITLTYTLNGTYRITSVTLTAQSPGNTVSDTAPGNASQTLTVSIPAAGNYTIGWTTGPIFEEGQGLPSIAVTCVGGPPAKTGTTTSLASSLNPSNVGDSVTFTATVAPTSGGGTPTGNLTFAIDGTNVGTVALSGGSASFTTSTLAAGTHPVRATYAGDAGFTASTSPVVNQVVTAAPPPPTPKSTTTSLDSSLNPSVVGDSVTFTAIVKPTSGGGTPAGNLTFSIDGVGVKTVALSAGKASYTTSALAAGSHQVTAAYKGSATFDPSTSPLVNQLVDEPDDQDSKDLRDMQIMATKIVAQTAGQSIQGAIDSSIADGFGQGGGPVDMGPQAFRFNFAAEPRARQSRPAPLDPLPFDKRAQAAGSAESASEALDASLGQTSQTHAMAGSSDGAMGARWRPWVDIRGTGWDTDDEQADIQGGQVNALAGITYKVSPSFLVGVFGGYENFDYSSDPLDADIDGDGWTGGAYLGWLITKGLRFDAGFAGSAIDYGIAAGTANGNFDATRWLFTSGLTGTQQVGAFIVEPSAKVYVLWENEDAYVDSLGTLQGERDFSTGRASGGLKLSYPVALDGGTRVVPFAGAYADYYFSDDSETILTGFEDSIEDGWAARFTGGLTFAMTSGVNATISGEVGGLGGGGAFNYSGRANLIIPF